MVSEVILEFTLCADDEKQGRYPPSDLPGADRALQNSDGHYMQQKPHPR